MQPFRSTVHRRTQTHTLPSRLSRQQGAFAYRHAPGAPEERLSFFLSAPAEPSRSYTERGQTELILFTYLEVLTNEHTCRLHTYTHIHTAIDREAYRPAPPRSSRMRQRGGQGIKNDGNMTVVCEGERGTCTT